MKFCSVDGCDNVLVARGLCSAHYAKVRKYGDPLAVRQVQMHGATLEERFWARVQKSEECWEWQGSRDPRGYGRLNVGGIPMPAHRLSYRINIAEPGRKHVLHRCDNPGCVRPTHLFLGTQKINNADKIAKGRARYGVSVGEEHGRAKLTNAAVLAIRNSTETQQALADRFGVSRTTIRHAKSGRGWKHLKE